MLRPQRSMIWLLASLLLAMFLAASGCAPGGGGVWATPEPEMTPELTPTPLPTVEFRRTYFRYLSPTPDPTPTPFPGWFLEVRIEGGPAWLRVIVDGEKVFEGTLQPGARKSWEASRTLTLRTGNAGATYVTLNEEELGPLGESGQVVEKTWDAEQIGATSGTSAPEENPPSVATAPSPVPTPTATATPRPPTPTPTPSAAVDLLWVLGKKVADVEQRFGTPTERVKIDPGGLIELPWGGESRTYVVSGYTIWVNYDTLGVARGVQVVDGLQQEGYSLSQWRTVLKKFGFPLRDPDLEAPAALKWENLAGYTVRMALDLVDGVIWTFHAYKR